MVKLVVITPTVESHVFGLQRFEGKTCTDVVALDVTHETISSRQDLLEIIEEFRVGQPDELEVA